MHAHKKIHTHTPNPMNDLKFLFLIVHFECDAHVSFVYVCRLCVFLVGVVVLLSLLACRCLM